MPETLIRDLNDEEIQETSMVELAYFLLKEKGEPVLYRNLMEEVAKLKGFSEEEKNRLIAQLYTEINIDGRFICVGKSLWGLKRWYSMDQSTDSAVAQNVKDDESDEELEDNFPSEDETDEDQDFRGGFQDYDEE
ncbi:DNA-directed RNA polymerase subunit delta [Melghirimyces algeriensis]|uniref:RNAP delta factor n=1 Tax=Melghirimyces algeriensis TaxID=910412 RepID=A0A521D9W4_9BACL|nr:DNA-directed RNA polymerase subunit delta [Melghirimyces algeriensis]SMO67690.1 DNA-directed RNA polymerase subunit delta [Melghirimyces algeriensis]